jgi:hypothetical protein
MDARVEQLVLDYLRRLEDAARGRLGPAEQVAFMARSRAAVARQIGETRAEGADDVRRLLRRFGDPDRLAAGERQRLDRLGQPVPGTRDGVKQGGMPQKDTGQDDPRRNGLRRSGSPSAATQALSGTAKGPSGTAKGPSGTADGPPGAADGPSGAAEQSPGTAEGSPGGAGEPGGARPASPAVPAASRRPRGRPAAAVGPGRQPGAAPALHRPMTAGWRPGQGTAPDHTADPVPGLRLGSRWPRPVAPPAAAGAPGPVAVPGSGRDNEQAPSGASDWEPGSAEPGTAGPGWPAGLLAVVRKHPLECVAILLIGLGGLIDPWPLWPVGALAMLASPLWGVWDKLAAVAIPLGFALIGAITLAGFSAHPPGLSGYAHEVHVEGWSLMRAGAVLGAAYLARRMQRGSRPRREPPWQRVPPAGG